LLIGSGTPYTTETVKGLLSMAPVQQYHSKAQAKHGIFYSYEVMDARTIDIAMSVSSEGDFANTPGQKVESYLDDLGRAFQMASPFANLLTIPLQSSAVDDPFFIKRPGKDVRQIFCHPIKREFDSIGAVAMGLAKGDIQLLAGDPAVYSADQHTFQTTIPSLSHNTGFFSVDNVGDFPSGRVVITIQGPGLNAGANYLWLFTNTTTNKSIALNMSLGGTDTVVIDLFAKSITLNGTSRYDLRRTDSEWWMLAPGINNFIVWRPGGDAVAATVTFQWYDAWGSA
jgi:hypothetical protein